MLTASGLEADDFEMMRVLSTLKCKSAAVSSIVKFIKKIENYKFPTDERGQPTMRDLVSVLGVELMRDYEPDPQEMAKLMLQSLVSAAGCSAMTLNLFWNMCTVLMMKSKISRLSVQRDL